MKLLLKLLLSFGILIVGIYAASPWWMPHILARQLPPGFQLDSLKAAYPGISGIHFKHMNVKGELPAFGLVLKATDIRFSYKGWKTEVGSVSLDVYMQPVKHGAADDFTIDELTLPITKLTGRPPEVSISELQLVLHHEMSFEPANIVAGEPLTLNFRAVNLLHRTNGSFHLSATVSTDRNPQVNGRFDLDINGPSRKAGIRFPGAANLSPWLTLEIEQTDLEAKTTTQIQTLLDAGADDHKWLDPIIEWGSGGRFTDLDGKLEAQALFAGEERQQIEHLSLTTNHLQALSDKETLNLDAQFEAIHDGENIIVSLPAPAEIQYEDHAGRINTLLENILPELKLHPRKTTLAHAVIDTNSRFIIHPGTNPLMAFKGNFNLDISSPGSNLGLRATDVQIEARDFSRLDSTSVEGLVTLDWQESNAFTYTGDELDLMIDEMSISAELTSSDGKLLSNGSGTLIDGQITSMATSSKSVEVSWHQLDLLTLVGELKASTQGFTTEIDGESWSGFDFDIGLALLSDADIKGSGTVQFDNGVYLPMEFDGNTQAGRWNITLPPSTVKLTHLDGLLGAAQIELPESIKLTGGFIDLGGSVLADDGISARIAIDGYEISASMLESSARNAGFSLDTSYGASISANGPVSIDIIELASGIDVGKIRVDLDLKSPEEITLQNLYAELFDGQLHLDNLHFSDNSIADTTIELSHINFGHLLAFADIDGLEGSGFLAFSLPAGSDQTGIHIKNGTFRSADPGRLAYKKEGVVDSNIGLQALENFHYKDLSGTIDYQSDGAYQIGIHLEGNNPDLYEGYPIVLNLNISGSLPELFEALFITGDFEESILKQIGIN